MRLEYPTDGVVVLAGLAGAGKTTLIRSGVDRATTLVVDPEDRREGARVRIPSKLLHARHFALTMRAAYRGGPVVVHSRGTSRLLRRMTARAAALGGHEAHLLLLDVARETAEAGQRSRGRTIGERRMERESARWDETMRRAVDERWSSVRILGRDEALGTSLVFDLAPATGGASPSPAADPRSATSARRPRAAN